MKIKYLAYWMGLNSLLCVIGGKNLQYRYFSSGENITLNCNSEVSFWSGPASNTLEPYNEHNNVEILDEYGKLRKWNISIYTKGQTVKDTLPQNLFKRLDLIGDNFDLLITNISTSDEGLYICDPNNSTVLQKRFLLQNKYKPSIKVNIKGNFVVEGESTQLCCISKSKPEPRLISWFKEDKELVSTTNRSSLCYQMMNVSRNDAGNYTCSSQNEIGNSFQKMVVVILYPAVVKVLIQNLTEDRMTREIQCLTQGEPDNVTYFRWEHRSIFNEHIRYLSGTNDGILRLLDVNITARYQDTGYYLCNVSNGIPDKNGKVVQQGRIFFVSKDPPVFMKNTNKVQFGKEGYQNQLTVYVYSVSNITCLVVSNLYGYTFSYTVRVEPILTTAEFYGTTIRLHGMQVVFSLPKLIGLHSQVYMVTVCNIYGNSTFDVEFKCKVDDSSEENALSSKGINIIIVMMIIIVILLVGMGICFLYLKQKYRTRAITTINNQTGELNINEIPHYAEIIEDDNVLTTPQGNSTQIIAQTNIIVEENGNTTPPSDEHSSSSFDTDINASEEMEDGYEKPYTILLANNGTEDEHVYRKTDHNLTDGNPTLLTSSASGHSIGFKQLELSLGQTKANYYANEGQENVKLNNDENYSKETDDGSQWLNAHKQRKRQEYINLSLKQ